MKIVSKIKTTVHISIHEMGRAIISTAMITTLLILSIDCKSQKSINTLGEASTENFDGIGTTSTATLPSGFRIGSDWSTASTTTTQAAGTSGTGVITGTSSGGVYNFANGVTASSTDRAVGFITTGSYSSPRSIIYGFTNNTGSTITNLSISWDYEKYRSGTRQFDWTFYHGNTSTPSTAATGGNQSYAADANNTVIYNPPTSTSKSVSISGLSIENGGTYYLLWTFTGSGGSTNCQAIGIDNFSITATSISSDATLSSLSLSSGTFSPTFSASTTSYSTSVNNSISSVTVTPTRNQNAASIQVQINNGGYSTVTSGSASSALNLNVGSNAIDIRVTAQDATTQKTYTITVTRDAFASVANPASFSSTTSSASQIDLSATANANTDNIIVVFNNTGTFATPTNGVAAGNAGDSFAGGTIFYKGAASGLGSHTGLTANSWYYYKAFSFDNTNSYSAGVSTSKQTAKTEPTNQASSLRISTVVTSSFIPLIWNEALAGSQAPDGYVVKLSTSSISDPTDGVDPGSGSSSISNGQAVFKASTGVTFTNATAGTMYNIKVFSYTNTDNLINYNTSQAPSFSIATIPNAVSGATFSATGSTTATVSWNSADGYNSSNHSTLVFIKAGNTISSGTPGNAPGNYSANSIFGSGTSYQADATAYCVYNGDGNSVNISALSPNTNYYVLIYTVVDATNSTNTNSYSSAVTTSGASQNLAAPVATAASAISSSSFTANWQTVAAATAFKLDASTSELFGTNFSNSLSEGFSGGTTVPANWTFTAIGSTYTTASNYGSSSPAISFDASGDAIKTPLLNGPATQLSVWIKGQGTNAASSLLIEGYNGSTWTTIQNITNSIPTTGTTYTYNSLSNPTLPANMVQFRFTYTKSSGNLALDDIAIQYSDINPSFLSGFNNLTVSGTSQTVTGLSANTTYYYRVRATNTENTSISSNTISIVTSPAAPLATQPTNIHGTGFTANWNTPAGGTTSYLFDLATDDAFANAVPGNINISVSGNSRTITGLLPNTTYYYRVRATNGTQSEYSNSISLATTSTITVGTSMSVSDLPACPTCDLRISNGAELTINTSSTFNTITVDPGSKLTLTNNRTLSGNLIIESDISGTGTFVDLNTADNPTSVVGSVKQYLSQNRNWYLSSPVNNADTSSLSTARAILYWNEEAGNWQSPVGNTFANNRGYISVATLSDGNIRFDGTLNSGKKEIHITRTPGATKEGFNLIGNPYPSYLIWTEQTAIQANAQPSIWYRTKNQSGTYSFQTYNANANLGVPASTTGCIPPMQAFWVRANTGGGDITFNNAMRTHDNMTTNKLKSKTQNQSTQKILRLELHSGNLFDETLIYYDAKASNKLDGYDTQKLFSDNMPEIYTMAENEKLVINGMNQPTDGEIIPVGIRSALSNECTLKVKEMSNFDPETKVYLIDKAKPDTETLLTEGMEYPFTPQPQGDSNQFGLVLKSAGITTAKQDYMSSEGEIVVSVNKGKLIVLNSRPENPIREIMIYDCLGKLLQTIHPQTNQHTISIGAKQGIYLLKTNTKQYTLTQKVVL